MVNYWSYLTNIKNEILALETYNHDDNDDNDYNDDTNDNNIYIYKIKSDYEYLIRTNFFAQFEDFTKIFISDQSPNNNPTKNKIFEISFNLN
jgi:hypothetical protein